MCAREPQEIVGFCGTNRILGCIYNYLGLGRRLEGCSQASDIRLERKRRDRLAIRTGGVYNLNNYGQVVNAHLAKEGYLPDLRFFYISSLFRNNPNFKTKHFTTTEDRALEVLSQNDIWIEELYETEWETIKINEIKRTTAWTEE